jgi:tRNA pseudouridine55 synthase
MDLPSPSKPPFDFKEGGLLLVNKPLDWTSFDVVNKLRFGIRRLYGQKKFKVGHAGTLDPRATGLLIICTGKWTKKLESLQGLPKSYTGTIELGATTPSYDVETEIDERFPTEHLTEATILAAIKELTGTIDQVPPVFSAIKVDGQRLYKKARKGQEVEIKSRSVTVNRFEATDIRIPEVDFAVDCTKGTYIRSLAYDLGRKLDNGGYLTSLRRTAIGPYRIEDAWEVDELVAHIEGLDRIVVE